MPDFALEPGIAAVGAGRKDVLSFILGGLVGAFIFTLAYGWLKSTFMFDKIGGGKATLAATNPEKYITLIASIPSVAVAGGIAIVFILIAWKLPDKV